MYELIALGCAPLKCNKVNKKKEKNGAKSMSEKKATKATTTKRMLTCKRHLFSTMIYSRIFSCPPSVWHSFDANGKNNGENSQFSTFQCTRNGKTVHCFMPEKWTKKMERAKSVFSNGRYFIMCGSA